MNADQEKEILQALSRAEAKALRERDYALAEHFRQVWSEEKAAQAASPPSEVPAWKKTVQKRKTALIHRAKLRHRQAQIKAQSETAILQAVEAAKRKATEAGKEIFGAPKQEKSLSEKAADIDHHTEKEFACYCANCVRHREEKAKNDASPTWTGVQYSEPEVNPRYKADPTQETSTPQGATSNQSGREPGPGGN